MNLIGGPGRLRLIAVFAAMALAGGCVGSRALAPDPPGSLVTVTRDGEVVGTVERNLGEIEGGREITTRQTIRVNVNGTRASTVIDETTRTENRQGDTVAVRHRSIVGRNEAVTTAEVVDGTALVRRESRGETREVTIVLPDDLRFDNGAVLLRDWNADETPRLEFHTLDVRAPLIERIEYSAAADPEPGGERVLTRLAFADGTLRSVSRLYVDASGTVLRSEQPMFGSSVETNVAVEDGTGRVMATNPVQASLVRSPYRISRAALAGHIRYTFAVEPDVPLLPPQTGEQRVTPVPGGFIVDICGTCGPGMDATESALSAALEPTFWLQSDHVLLAELGSEVGASDATDLEKMTRLEDWARGRMREVDFAGHFSAVEALTRGAGDCTESAVVLAALGRAAGIPTRVASGVVYSREQYHGVSNVFTPHAWTLAYVDGQWRSFDIALEGFDASHIALTISDGDPGSIQSGQQLAALLRWDGMTEVREAPADSAP